MDPFFRPKTVIGRHKILAHRRQNLSRVKTGQNRLRNKTVIKLVDHCHKSYDQHVIALKSIYKKGKNCLLLQNELG